MTVSVVSKSTLRATAEDRASRWKERMDWRAVARCHAVGAAVDEDGRPGGAVVGDQQGGVVMSEAAHGDLAQRVRPVSNVFIWGSWEKRGSDLPFCEEDMSLRQP